jgi:hypothetical protein
MDFKPMLDNLRHENINGSIQTPEGYLRATEADAFYVE